MTEKTLNLIGKLLLIGIFITIFGIMLAACESDEPKSRDDVYEHTITIHVVSHDKLLEYAQLYSVDSSLGLEGFARYTENEDNTNCTIFVPEPTSTNNVITWGHELMHCVYRSYHHPTSNLVFIPKDMMPEPK